MNFEISKFGKNVITTIIENCTAGFFRGAVDMMEDIITNKIKRKGFRRTQIIKQGYFRL